MEESFTPCYNMGNRYRGHAVIISNETFTHLAKRDGARKDAEKLQALFKALDFHVSTFMNLKASEMQQVIEKASESPSNLESDCFVLVLSSHGFEQEATESSLNMHLPNDAAVWRHAVLGVDDVPIYVDDILKRFDCKFNSQSLLRDKPKLFFIQACQSGHLSYRRDGAGALACFDTGTNVTVRFSKTDLSTMQPTDAWQQEDTFVEQVQKQPVRAEYDDLRNETNSWLPGKSSELSLSSHVTQEAAAGTTIDPSTPVGARPVRQTSYDIVALSCPEDCLVMYPTMSGKFAYRHSEVGSYMLHFMCQQNIRDLLLYGHDILQFVTAVNGEMSKIEIYLTLTADVVPNPQERAHLQENMPLKMSARIIHRLSKSLKFAPKSVDSITGRMRTMET